MSARVDRNLHPNWCPHVVENETGNDKHEILVAESDDRLAATIESALQVGGFSTTRATTGYEALMAASLGSPDLVILDVSLSGSDGIEICRRMRSDQLDVPVIFISLLGTVDESVRCLAAGGDDLISRALHMGELIARIHAVLRRVIRHTPKVLRCGELVLDCSGHQVLRNSRVVDLQPTEFELLRYFMSHVDETLSRQRIVQQVWGKDFDGRPTVVDLYVSTLRKKLGFSSGEAIRTVRGAGYRMSL